MGAQTNSAGTADWLMASRGTLVKAHIEAHMATLTIRESPLPRDDFYDTLRSISVVVPPGRVVDAEVHLDEEFRAWDTLSDDALRAFEAGLD